MYKIYPKTLLAQLSDKVFAISVKWHHCSLKESTERIVVSQVKFYNIKMMFPRCIHVTFLLMFSVLFLFNNATLSH